MIAIVSRIAVKGLTASLFAVFIAASFALSQSPATKYKSQEISETNDVPVLVEHLPNWQSVSEQTTFATNTAQLRSGLGDRKIVDLVDFSAGTEAVAAPYDAGKLLIIEYTSPQASVDADNKFKAELATDEQAATTVYRRIGNYNVFVFDAADTLAANALVDQVKYEKQVQWLGANPFRLSPERAFVVTTTDMFISTVLIVVIGIGLSLGGGLIAGYVFFYIRDHRRGEMTAFSDAGGMTRLNLDGLTSDIASNRLLKD